MGTLFTVARGIAMGCIAAIAAGLAATPDGANALLDTVAAGKASPRLLQERPVQVKLDALKNPTSAGSSSSSFDT